MFSHDKTINRAGTAMARAFRQAAEELIRQRESERVWNPKDLGLKRFTFKSTGIGGLMLAKGFNAPRIAVTNGSIALDLIGSERHDEWLRTHADVHAATGPSWEKQTLGINPEILDQRGWPIQKLHHEKAGVNAVLLNAALKWVGDGEITVKQKPTDPLGPILVTNVERLVCAVVMPVRLA
tara:strand:+ start:2139 stop:2681 length:543 start_codon:yes stop_codon:yes gene_type:complete